MSVSDYESLSTEEKVAAADGVARDGTDAEQYNLLKQKATHETENGCYHAIGEPTGSIRCEECYGTIPLGTECATIKCFSRDENPDESGVHWEPEIICLNCADNACVDADYKVGLIVQGALERCRTRPGDPSSAPYVYYVTPDEDNPTVNIVTDVDKGSGTCFDCW